MTTATRSSSRNKNSIKPIIAMNKGVLSESSDLTAGDLDRHDIKSKKLALKKYTNRKSMNGIQFNGNTLKDRHRQITSGIKMHESVEHKQHQHHHHHPSCDQCGKSLKSSEIFKVNLRDLKSKYNQEDDLYKKASSIRTRDRKTASIHRNRHLHRNKIDIRDSDKSIDSNSSVNSSKSDRSSSHTSSDENSQAAIRHSTHARGTKIRSSNINADRDVLDRRARSRRRLALNNRGKVRSSSESGQKIGKQKLMDYAKSHNKDLDNLMDDRKKSSRTKDAGRVKKVGRASEKGDEFAKSGKTLQVDIGKHVKRYINEIESLSKKSQYTEKHSERFAKRLSNLQTLSKAGHRVSRSGFSTLENLVKEANRQLALLTKEKSKKRRSSSRSMPRHGSEAIRATNNSKHGTIKRSRSVGYRR